MIKAMSKVVVDDLKIQELLARSVEKIYPSREFLEQKLKSGEQLSVYLGIDPTGPDLHLGHSVQLLTLKKFQNLGHKVVLVIGDFTARIGDPSGRDKRRRPLSEKEVKENEKTYKEQVGKILDLRKTSIEYNNRWLKKLNFGDILKLASLKTVQQLLDRDMFQKRIEKGDSIGVHEFLYPLMQGYDSVALKVDGEIGATDQTFNMLVGRDLEKDYLGKEKFILTTRLLVNPKTGKKMMSKSEGDYISLGSRPQEMYAKVLALPDEAIFEVFELCTEVPMGKIDYLKSGDILTAKHELAFEITKMYHGEKGALFGKEEFNRVFREKEMPQEKRVFIFPDTEKRPSIINLFSGSGVIPREIPSISEFKRLISQGAIEDENGNIISDWHQETDGKGVFKIGQKKFVEIKLK